MKTLTMTTKETKTIGPGLSLSTDGFLTRTYNAEDGISQSSEIDLKFVDFLDKSIESIKCPADPQLNGRAQTKKVIFKSFISALTPSGHKNILNFYSATSLFPDKKLDEFSGTVQARKEVLTEATDKLFNQIKKAMQAAKRGETLDLNDFEEVSFDPGLKDIGL